MSAIPNNKRLSVRPFLVIWGGQAFSLFGSQLVQFALIWWLTSQTGSGTVLATASLVGLLPQVLLGPFIGPLIDRWNRRWTMMGADALVALATLALAILFAAGIVQIWHVYMIMFIRALAGSFHWPAMNASMSLMVPEEHLSRVQGLNQTLHGALNIGSAPLAALLLSTVPLQAILAIDVFTAVLAIIPLIFIFVPQPDRSSQLPGESDEGKRADSYWDDLRAGLRYVWGWPGLMAILIMAMLINLTVNPAFALLPLLVTNYFNGDALDLAWLEATFGIGMILGGLILGVWGGFKRRIVTTLIGLMASGLAILLLGLTPTSVFIMAIVAIFFAGVTIPIVNGPLQAVFQATVDPEMQGRVFALIGSLASAMTPIGLIIAGPLSDTIGVRTWFMIAGVVMMLAGIVGFFIPAIMHIEDNRRPEESEIPEPVSAPEYAN
jgi:DHA3 family macrolide efflux protein-like MFS transporter